MIGLINGSFDLFFVQGKNLPEGLVANGVEVITSLPAGIPVNYETLKSMQRLEACVGQVPVALEVRFDLTDEETQTIETVLRQALQRVVKA